MVAPSHSPSGLRVRFASPVCDSNERTDERTNEDANTDCGIRALSATCGRVQAEDIVELGEVIEAGFLHSGQRFPITRTGQRDPIPYQLRAAIYIRDRAICQKCRTRDLKSWELDHIIPWSAGGPDHSTNLRVLCAPCNQERGNYDDGTTFTRSPATWWCHRCYDDPTWTEYGITREGRFVCPQHGRSCRVRRITDWQLSRDEPIDWFFRSTPVEATGTLAFCAHCNRPSRTDVTL